MSNNVSRTMLRPFWSYVVMIWTGQGIMGESQPLIYLFLELFSEFVDPLLQPLPPLLGRQVAVILQRWGLVMKTKQNYQLRVYPDWRKNESINFL